MALIKPIDVIQGISGKYGSGSKDYFATNKSSNQIRLAKLNNPYEGPATELQLAQQAKFKARSLAVSAWLNANKPNAVNGPKGTEAYQYALKLKFQYHVSNINQVLYKHMNDENVIILPESANDDTPSGGGSQNQGGGNQGGGCNPSGNVTLTLTAGNGGKVQIGSDTASTSVSKSVAPGTQLTIKAIASPGYGFDSWSDGQGGATRTITVNSDMTLNASFISGEDE